MKSRAVLLVLLSVFITPFYLNAHEMPEQYREKFSESFHIRKERYNELGQQVRTLVNKTQIAGNYSIQWDGLNDNGQSLSSGVYFYNIEANTSKSKKFIETKKMIVLK